MVLQIAKVVPAIERELSSTKDSSEDIVFFFEKNKSLLKEVALFGGAIRDIFLFGKISDESDLDFVVRCDKESLRRILVGFDPIENKFGGFRFLFGCRNIDIWPLAETWAIKNGYVKNDEGMMDLLSTTFFNVDAVYYRIFEHTLVCSKKFEEGIKNKELDVILKDNPSPSGIMKRIEKMSSEKNLSLNSAVKKYIKSS